MLDITQIPAPRIPLLDERTGLLSRQWYRFFYNLYVLTGGGTNAITLEELQLGPPNQPDFTEILKEVNNNISPEYQDQSGNFLATLDNAQLMAMMARFETAEAAIQGAYLQPVVQTGTIANYNLDGSPTAGGVVYGTGSAMAVSVAGTSGQVLKSNAAGAPTWVTDGGGTVTSVTGTAPVVSSGGTTPAISMPVATALVDGYLSSTDWATFNAKQPAGSYLVSGGALGTPSSGTVTNLTGTASININGTVGATTANTGAFTTLSTTDNITPLTAAKGVNFTANTPAAGMTSQLLNWYEEGTWTAGYAGWTTAPTYSDARYIRIGKQITVIILGQSGVNAGNQAITGLPFTSSNVVTPTGALKVFGSSALSSLCNIDNSATSINSFSAVTLTGNYWSLSITYFMTF